MLGWLRIRHWDQFCQFPEVLDGCCEEELMAGTMRLSCSQQSNQLRRKSFSSRLRCSLRRASAGAKQLSVALQMVLSLEGVEFQPARSQLPNVRK
jgi:hypothetical protein